MVNVTNKAMIKLHSQKDDKGKRILYIIGNGFDLAFAKSCRTDKQTIEIINL